MNIQGGTLGGLTALSLEAQHNAGGLEEAFLMKKFRVCYAAEGIEVSDNVMLVLTRGQLSVADVGAGLAVVDSPEDDYAVAQATVRRIIDLVMVPNHGGATGTHGLGFTWDVDLPSKGLPFGEREGWELFLFNPSTSPWVTGSVHNCTNKIWGIFL